jgi:hypothetical protein
MSCRTCKAENPIYNKLGECRSCHDSRIDALRRKKSDLPALVIKWIGEGEKRYGKSIFYSDEIDSKEPGDLGMKAKNFLAQKTHMGKPAYGPEGVDVVKLAEEKGTVKLGALPFGQRLAMINNGMAEGFLSSGKNFKLMHMVRPSKAVRKFITGQLTVCECEGMMRVVFLNAICEWAGDELFDLVFADLQIDSASGDRFHQTYWDFVETPGEEACALGDWVYYAHASHSAEKFRQLATISRKGGAATGWNLTPVQCGGVGQNLYVGFGMAIKDDISEITGMPLAKVRESMIRAVGGDPGDRDWDLRLVWRRRLDGNDLVKFFEQKLIA